MRLFLGCLRFILAGSLFSACFCLAIISALALYLGPQLPRIESVLDLKLQTPLRVYTADGLLIGEFGEARRQPLPYSDLPPLFVKAVLAAEDDSFFTHKGVDASGLLRAASEIAKTGKIQSGGSTITMQLARNFFLSNEKSFVRKFNEILLSVQLERTLSKEQIFELYANKIFLGHRAYGAQAAANVYYGKNLAELSLAQWAMIAGLPKAPSKFNPLVNPERALLRRNWILDRMLKLGYIDQPTHDAAIQEMENASFHGQQTDMNAPFVAELARQFAIEKLGERAYTDGISIHTTIDSRLQRAAQEAVWLGTKEYDSRHGYRGPEKHYPAPGGDIRDTIWVSLLKEVPVIGDLEPAIVLQSGKTSLVGILRNGQRFSLQWSPEIAKQLQPYKSEDHLGGIPANFTQVFKTGDLVRLRANEPGNWQIGQVPAVQAALVSIDSRTGAIIALSGGSDFAYSKFNRATQALRQPGSSFKPFIYLKALENGYTPATIVNDAPIVFQEAGMEEAWRPENSGGDYLGPTRLRRALYESRNMVSIRVLQNIGVKNAIKSLERFGFETSKMQPNLSLALGTHAFTPLAMAGAYSILANGGFQVQPFIVQRIVDSTGNTVYQQPAVVACSDCDAEFPGQAVQPANRVIDEQNAYIIDDMLKDVIRRGTGRPALVLERPDIAGKTGTTNGPTDVWFAGYNPAIATTVWLGFDNNTPLGKREYGGTAALPIWISFMREALAGKPVIERTMPPGLRTMRIDPDTGQLTSSDRPDAIFEIFRGEAEGNSAESNNSAVGTPAETGSGGSSEDLF
jgi:penicillin-binding protein 1A